jgi:hypothetical protein
VQRRRRATFDCLLRPTLQEVFLIRNIEAGNRCMVFPRQNLPSTGGFDLAGNPSRVHARLKFPAAFGGRFSPFAVTVLAVGPPVADPPPHGVNHAG